MFRSAESKDALLEFVFVANNEGDVDNERAVDCLIRGSAFLVTWI